MSKKTENEYVREVEEENQGNKNGSHSSKGQFRDRSIL